MTKLPLPPDHEASVELLDTWNALESAIQDVETALPGVMSARIAKLIDARLNMREVLQKQVFARKPS